MCLLYCQIPFGKMDRCYSVTSTWNVVMSKYIRLGASMIHTHTVTPVPSEKSFKSILPSGARKCFTLWEKRNTIDTLSSCIYRGDYIFLTRQSKYHVPQNNRSTKIHLDEKNKFASFSWYIKYSGNSKKPLPTGASSGEGPVITIPFCLYAKDNQKYFL